MTIKEGVLEMGISTILADAVTAPDASTIAEQAKGLLSGTFTVENLVTIIGVALGVGVGLFLFWFAYRFIKKQAVKGITKGKL